MRAEPLARPVTARVGVDAVTAVDWIIVAFVVLMALWGYAQGLVVSALSLAGFAAGAFAGSRLAPVLLDQGSNSPYAPLFSLVTALMVGGLTAIVFEALGEGIRRRMSFRAADVLDGIGGAVLVATLGLGLVWIAGAVALQTPGARELRRDIQRSAILSKLNDALPPSGPLLNALARADPFPRIRGPAADVPAPTRGILRDRDVQQAQASVVRVLGHACGLAVQGSGWVARPGVVVTNAHVVAGEDDTTVEVDGGDGMDATAVVFDPHNDVALLSVPGLGAPALDQRTGARAGAPVAILGYPENGPYRSVAGRLGETRTVLSRDAYGNGPVRRRMTSLRGTIRSGNSGGPAVDSAGRVVATVFAATTNGSDGGFGVPPGIVEAALDRAGRPVDTGPCVR
jgi:Trypsin-like peptidase domain/Colicin V production protein